MVKNGAHQTKLAEEHDYLPTWKSKSTSTYAVTLEYRQGDDTAVCGSVNMLEGLADEEVDQY